MKAIVYQNYGAPDVLQLVSLPKPEPTANEIRIKIKATTVSSEDGTFRRGSPFIARSATGFIKPKKILGTALAGEVEAIGDAVTRYAVGDRVFGATGEDFGGYAEYICLPEDSALTTTPADLGDEDAVVLAAGPLTALPFLRDEAKLQAGQKILINGASGSVGSAAVQLAKYFGAEVTAVCSSRNVELVRSLGADHIIDYSKQDFTKSEQRFDVIFDAVGKSSFSRCKSLLNPNGIYLSTVLSAGILFQSLWTSVIGRKRAKIAFTGLRPVAEKAKDLVLFKKLRHSGELKAVIDRRYRLDQIVEAHAYVDTGHKVGDVVITV